MTLLYAVRLQLQVKFNRLLLKYWSIQLFPGTLPYEWKDQTTSALHPGKPGLGPTVPLHYYRVVTGIIINYYIFNAYPK